MSNVAFNNIIHKEYSNLNYTVAVDFVHSNFQKEISLEINMSNYG